MVRAPAEPAPAPGTHTGRRLSGLFRLEADRPGLPLLAGLLRPGNDVVARLAMIAPVDRDGDADFPARRLEAPLDRDDLIVPAEVRDELAMITAWPVHGRELRDSRTSYYGEINGRLIKLGQWSINGHGGLSGLLADPGHQGLRLYFDWSVQASRALGGFSLSFGVAATNYPIFGPDHGPGFLDNSPRAFAAISRAF